MILTLGEIHNEENTVLDRSNHRFLYIEQLNHTMKKGPQMQKCTSAIN